METDTFQQNNPNTITTTVEKKKHRGALIAGFVICAVLAVGGICSGVYFYLAYQAEVRKLSSLPVDTISPTEEIRDTENTENVEKTEKTADCISDTVSVSKNPVLTDTASLGFRIRANGTFDGSAPEYTGYSISASVQNGHASCSIYPSIDFDCDFGITSGISKVVYGTLGQDDGGSVFLFVMENGTVEYVPVYKAYAAKSFKTRGKLPIEGFVKDAVSIDVHAPENCNYDSDNCWTGGYLTVMFIRDDNTYVLLDEFEDFIY